MNHAIAKYSFHTLLLKPLYKIVAPKHPKGWIDVHCIIENDSINKSCWIRTYGMQKWRLPNVEIVNVPHDLAEYVHGLIFTIAGYKDGNDVSEKLVSPNQVTDHSWSFRYVNRAENPSDNGFLRIVDFNQSAQSGFPRKLFAAHLVSLAGKSSNSDKKRFLLKRATEIYRGDNEPDQTADNAASLNPGNFFSWEALGNLECDRGNYIYGLFCLETAAGNWPFGGRKMAEMYSKLMDNGELPSPENSIRSKFWSDWNTNR
jgi:hypothetical protein